jgi:hypothetical protein
MARAPIKTPYTKMIPCPKCTKYNIVPCYTIADEYGEYYQFCAIDRYASSISRCKTFEDLSNEPCFMKSDKSMDLYFNKALELYYPRWFAKLQKLIILK